MTTIGRSLTIKKPYLLFLGDVDDMITAKTACGIRDWANSSVIGQWRTSPQAVDLGLADLDPKAAVAMGAQSLIVGAAPPGGVLPAHWLASLQEAAAAGLDLVCGLHSKLVSYPELVTTASAAKVSLTDVRTPPAGLPVATGQKRSGQRVLTVGADCAIGKKYAALSIAREMARRDWDHDFRATGQTGIMISGGGIPMDAVVSDFLAGAAEVLSPSAQPQHWDVIEGQGSLFHPAYAGVTLGLIHGSQPDAIIYCHSLMREKIDGVPGYMLPDPETGIARNLDAARLTNPKVRLGGIAINTAHLTENDAHEAAAALAKTYGAPCFDPLRFGADSVIDQLAEFAA
jgi:uncharacterized NAD-dependent epimerase/dehydratase family protein